MHNSVCIITGAGSGMGYALAIRLARAGARLALVGRNEAKISAAAEACRALDADCVSFALDVADEAAVQRMSADVLSRWGRIDVLVNNAGHSSKNRRLMNTSLEEMRSVIDSNLIGTILCARAVVPTMLKQGSGTILNVSSRAGTHPGPFGGMIYSAAKAAVINFTGYLQEELKNKNVRCSVIVPGEVDTPIVENRPIVPTDDARKTMVSADDAAEVMFHLLALPQSVSLPQVHLLPTMLRDISGEIQRD